MEVFDAIAAEMAGEGTLVEGNLTTSFPSARRMKSSTRHTTHAFEMLMIDLALSSEITGESLRTPTEVSLEVERRQRRALHFAAGVVELLAGAAAAVAVLAGLLLKARSGSWSALRRCHLGHQL